MAKRYRVRQFNEQDLLIHSEVYRSRVWAIIMAWVVAGPGLFDRYHSDMTEIEVED